LRVKNALEKAPSVVYFGLYENETSAIADLVIPAKTFLEKDDIRTSYAHNGFMVMNKQIESDIGISEYDLAAYLCKEFDIELKSEQEYLEHFKNFGVKKINGCFEVEKREKVPYKNGFDTSDGEFVFLEEFETHENEGEDEFNLITPKSNSSLNSQFNRDKYVYINSSCGYEEGEKIEIISENGSVVLEVKNDNRLRDDTLLIYSGTPGVNNLTSSKHSYEGKSAVFQENKVKIMKIKREYRK